eukprot:385930_1
MMRYATRRVIGRAWSTPCLASRQQGAAQKCFYHAGMPLNNKEVDATAVKEKDFKLLTPGHLVQKLGLDDWRMALPAGIIAAVPALTQDFIIISEETQIVGCFVMFVAAIYTQFGDAIAKSLDAQSSAVLAALNKQEDVNVEITKARLDECKAVLGVVDDTKAIHALHLDTLDTLAKSRTAQYKHQLRDKYMAVLDHLVLQEANRKATAHADLVNGAVEYVMQEVKRDKGIQKTALDQALATLANNKASGGADPVMGLFTDYLKKASLNAKAGLNKTVTLSEEEWEKENVDAQAVWDRFTGPPAGMSKEEFEGALKTLNLALPPKMPELPRSFIPATRTKEFLKKLV